MKRRNLGKTGFEVSEVGLGCWQFGGDFGPIEDQTSMDTMHEATRAGINFFDTADVYGDGRSETVIRGYKDCAKVANFVATKVGRSARLYPDKYSYEGLRDDVEASRKRLGVDSLDLVQLHCVPTEVLRDGRIFADMNRLQAEGCLRNWGASVETIEEAKICLDQDGLSTLQIIFNLYRQDAVTELFPLAQERNVGIIARLPLASGMLTGKFSPDHKFPETDHRNYNAEGAAFSVGETFSGIELRKGVAALKLLQPYVPAGWTLADFALRWILDHPAISTVIAGCSSPVQVRANARASDLEPLSQPTHDALTEIYRREIRPLVRCQI
jgi:aryl-alcohol dehydrogenase-like predicted oxidoreductase